MTEAERVSQYCGGDQGGVEMEDDSACYPHEEVDEDQEEDNGDGGSG